MSTSDWEKKVLEAPGAEARVAEVRAELRSAVEEVAVPQGVDGSRPLVEARVAAFEEARQQWAAAQRDVAEFKFMFASHAFDARIDALVAAERAKLGLASIKASSLEVVLKALEVYSDAQVSAVGREAIDLVRGALGLPPRGQ